MATELLLSPVSLVPEDQVPVSPETLGEVATEANAASVSGYETEGSGGGARPPAPPVALGSEEPDDDDEGSALSLEAAREVAADFVQEPALVWSKYGDAPEKPRESDPEMDALLATIEAQRREGAAEEARLRRAPTIPFGKPGLYTFVRAGGQLRCGRAKRDDDGQWIVTFAGPRITEPEERVEFYPHGVSLDQTMRAVERVVNSLLQPEEWSENVTLADIFGLAAEVSENARVASFFKTLPPLDLEEPGWYWIVRDGEYVCFEAVLSEPRPGQWLATFNGDESEAPCSHVVFSPGGVSTRVLRDTSPEARYWVVSHIRDLTEAECRRPDLPADIAQAWADLSAVRKDMDVIADLVGEAEAVIQPDVLAESEAAAETSPKPKRHKRTKFKKRQPSDDPLADFEIPKRFAEIIVHRAGELMEATSEVEFRIGRWSGKQRKRAIGHLRHAVDEVLGMLYGLGALSRDRQLALLFEIDSAIKHAIAGTLCGNVTSTVLFHHNSKEHRVAFSRAYLSREEAVRKAEAFNEADKHPFFAYAIDSRE